MPGGKWLTPDCTAGAAVVKRQGSGPGKLQSELQRQTIEVNANLDGHEKIAGVIISAQDWNSENGLVTHTLKIKRAALEQRYAALAEKAFSIGASVKQPLVLLEDAGVNSHS